MHISIDGMAGRQEGATHFNWDAELRQYSIENAANAGSILLVRKTAENFIPHWKSVADNPKAPDLELGRLITDKPKIVFSKSLQEPQWPNATVANGEIAECVNQLKQQTGNDLLVYGGLNFVASLIAHNLVDEYHLLVNPVILGGGFSISKAMADPLRLTLLKRKAFACGTVLLCYKPFHA